jgi:penicillin-binding protein 1A
MSSQGRESRSESNPPVTAAPRKRQFVIFAILMVIAALTGGGTAYFLNLDLPDVRGLQDYRPATISRLLAADGQLIHQFATERRIVIPYGDIPVVLRNAVVAVEDSKFFSHIGVDPTGIARAAFKDLVTMSREEGASTITQQLARGLFLRRDKTFTRKIREAVLAIHIEKAYTKEEIFTFYSNQSYTGHGFYGFEAASRYFFSHRAKELTLPEAAMLAGIIQRPSNLSPYRHSEAVIKRRNHVLRRMLAEKYITQAEHDEAVNTPLELVPPETSLSVGDYFIEQVRRDLDSRLGEDALFKSGLTIETGLDLELQRQAERALQKGVREVAKRAGFVPPDLNILDDEETDLDSYQHTDWKLPLEPGMIIHGLVIASAASSATVRVGEREFDLRLPAIAWTKKSNMGKILPRGTVAPFLIVQKKDGTLNLELSAEPTANGAVIAMDPTTGEIRAWVGGIDFGTSQFDRAIQARRQPGSAFKPVIYSAAMEEGWSTTDVLLDEPTVFVDPQALKPYQPENYYKDYQGIITFRHALEHSLNIPTIRLLNMVGYQRTIEQARRLGIKSPIRPYPAMGLGASEVTLAEMVSAYSAFANLGTRLEPRLVTRIRAFDGTIMYDERPSAVDALRPEVAYLMTSLLRGVVARGTARKAGRLGTELAGKTGTTDDNTDAWFIGYTPSLVVGVWVGKDEKQSLGSTETGPKAALPIWMDIIESYLSRGHDETFRTPPGIGKVPVDPTTGLRAGVNTGCNHQTLIIEAFRRDQGPPPLCSPRDHFRSRLPYYLQRFPWVADRTLALTEDDLVRILRESSLEVAMVGLNTLMVESDTGSVELKFMIVTPNDPLIASMEGAAALSGHLAINQSGRDRNHGLDLRFPPDLGSLNPDVDAHPPVGVDGRTAARIRIRYP